ncbi:hypothetical protein KR009_007489, partial [Drosophila setifemur]
YNIKNSKIPELNPNIETASKWLIPLVKSPIGQLVISFVLGYFATTKLSQMYNNFKGPGDKNQADSSANKDVAELPFKGKKAIRLSLQQLSAFNGQEEELPIYTALNGNIYDLSSARDKFSSQGPYSLLAGCDANHVLNIACGSMGVCTDDIVQRWEQSLKAEFNIVGYLIDAE